MGKTHYELCLELRYATSLWRMHECLWRRTKALLSALTLVGGSAAVYSVISANPKIVAASGVVLAIIAALDLVLAPTDKAVEYLGQFKRYQKLFAESRQMSAEDLYDAIERLRIDDSLDIQSLQDIAYKRTCIANELPDDVQLSLLQRALTVFI